MDEDTRCLKIGMVLPPLSDHQGRGTGTYTKELIRALQKRRDVSLSVIRADEIEKTYDLIHYPYFDPFFLTLPLISTLPTVVTVHDMIPLKFPHLFPAGIRGSIKWQIQKFSLSRKHAIITDSFASKEDIRAYAHIPIDHIYPIYLGVSEEYVPASMDTQQRVQSQYHLEGPYVMYVGDINPNKNISRLLRVYANIIKKYPDVTLCLVGKAFCEDSLEKSEIDRYIDSQGLETYVRRVGYIPIDHLCALYSGAWCSVQVSLAEGFGLPVLESMACGCPVVTSNTSSLSEIGKGAALLVDPEREDDMYAGISRFISDEHSRDEYRKKGIEHAKTYTWDECAKKTVDVYKAVSRLV